MTKSDIYYFVGKCLFLDKNPGYRNEFVELYESNSINWDEFIHICDTNYVLPTVYLKFRKHNILGFLSPDLSELLLEIYELNCVRNKAILRQIEEIINVLNQYDIFPTFLKGAGNLIDGLYSDVGERFMIDIDFLVPEKDFLNTAEILINHGYLTYRKIEILETWKWKHYPPLYHPDFPSSIEIHRIPTHHKRKWFSQDTINSERKTVSNFKGCFVPSYDHKIVHNFIHSQLSHKGNLFGTILLRDIYDILLLSDHSSLIATLPKIKKTRKCKLPLFRTN